MNREECEKRLFGLQDPEYRSFHSSLVPNIPAESIIGVRIPLLKQLAKEMYSGTAKDKQEFMNELPHRYYEENQLHIMMICLEKDFDAVIPFFENRRLEPWTHNKAIQKAIESYRVSAGHKEYLRTLKIRK